MLGRQFLSRISLRKQELLLVLATPFYATLDIRKFLRQEPTAQEILMTLEAEFVTMMAVTKLQNTN